MIKKNKKSLLCPIKIENTNYQNQGLQKGHHQKIFRYWQHNKEILCTVNDNKLNNIDKID